MAGSNVKYKQEETLERAYGILSEMGVKVKHSRMDCGSFDQSVIPVVEANSEYFYIRAQRCASLYNLLKDIIHWETEIIGFKTTRWHPLNMYPSGERKLTVMLLPVKRKPTGRVTYSPGMILPIGQ